MPLSDPMPASVSVPADSGPSAAGTTGHRVGYVLKMYPRFSETFVVSEILARERRGTDLEIFSLRLPTDGRFHETVADVQAPVSYLPTGRMHSVQVWELLHRANGQLPGFGSMLDTLCAVEAEIAIPALELAMAVRHRGITHLHAHFGSLATSVARIAAQLTGVSYSFTAHAKDIFCDTVDHTDLQAKLDDADHVVTVSDYNVDYLHQRYAIDPDKLHRVYNGLDLSTFEYREPHGREPVIAAVGRLVEKKGFATLLAACELLQQRQGRQFRCVLAGAGPLENDLRQAIHDRGLDHVVNMPGPLTQARVRALVTSAACLAAPCVPANDGNRDGLPTVLLEAMALGTPCVSTTVTGIPEVVRHGSTGLLVEPDDPVALADALATLLDDTALRLDLARDARSLVASTFDVADQAHQLDALLPPGDLNPVDPNPVDSVAA